MGYSIGCHHQLESMESWEEIGLDIIVPHPLLSDHTRVDMSDDLIEECTSPSSRIEDLDTMNLSFLGFAVSFFVMSLSDSLMFDLARISESSMETKMSPEHIIDRSHDESDHRSRSIEYSSLHTQ